MASFSRSIYFLRPFISGTRGIMTSPFRADKALEDLKRNPHFDKYAKKITAVQSSSPEDFVSKLEKIHIAKSKPVETIEEDRQFSAVLEPKPAFPEPLCTKQKLLDDIMKTELINNKSPDEIKKIWEEFHKHKDVVAATIPSDVYEKISEMSKQFPLFLFPLPRDKGYEFILCQFSGHEVHFTPLVNYQAHKENAPECLTLVHYSEVKDKGIILMRGEYNKEILNATEALCLTNQLQMYYCRTDEKRLKLMERFTYKPDEFQHMDLVAELECLTADFYIK